MKNKKLYSDGLVAFRASADEIKSIDKLAKRLKTNRSDVLRRILRVSLLLNLRKPEELPATG